MSIRHPSQIIALQRRPVQFGANRSVAYLMLAKVHLTGAVNLDPVRQFEINDK